ncbi:hypothetical protein H5410_057234 [Solanum commersonii]|uniref:Uncharacterized protein n=1 Tax=Solanum commersonii TaxID=4109 RepID=A0A9J5WPJ4_SOLCO|nr:hypothetical protein H5410_057234 [Solanum commersonii]
MDAYSSQFLSYSIGQLVNVGEPPYGFSHFSMECALEIKQFQVNGLAELDLNLSRQQVTDLAQNLSVNPRPLLLPRKGSCFQPDVYKLILSYSQLDILELWEFLFTKNYEDPQRFWALKGGIGELKALDPNIALDQIASLAAWLGRLYSRFQRQNTHATGEIWSNGFCLNQQIVSAEPSAAHCMHISSVQQ